MPSKAKPRATGRVASVTDALEALEGRRRAPARKRQDARRGDLDLDTIP